jgi:hypothetical protein
MMKAYLLVGVPCSGKSTITSQLGGRYVVVEKDDFIGREGDYASAVARAARESKVPVVANTPFGMSDLVIQLEAHGLEVEPVFIIEPEDVIVSRYVQREGRRLPARHLALQLTYARRARELGAFAGTAAEALHYLRAEALDTTEPGPEKDELVDELLAVGGSKR